MGACLSSWKVLAWEIWGDMGRYGEVWGDVASRRSWKVRDGVRGAARGGVKGGVRGGVKGGVRVRVRIRGRGRMRVRSTCRTMVLSEGTRPRLFDWPCHRIVPVRSTTKTWGRAQQLCLRMYRSQATPVVSVAMSTPGVASLPA